MHQKSLPRHWATPAVLIEHIGSTSVPGLAAKPISDIFVVVTDCADESTYRPQVDSDGYVLRVREPDWNEHRMFGTPDRDVHALVYSAGCAEIERTLGFRDRLRTNAQDRQRYEQTKHTLARIDWPNMDAHADAKAEVIESIISAARAAGSM